MAGNKKLMAWIAPAAIALSLCVLVAALAMGRDYHAVMLAIRLRYGAPATQRDAAENMAEIRTPSGIRTAIKELIKCLDQTKDESVRAAVIRSLARLCLEGGRTLETQRATEAIIAATEDQNFQATRALALKELGLCVGYHDDAIIVLERALKSSERDICESARLGVTFLSGLSKEAYPRGVNALVDVLENDDRPEARSAAAWALSNVYRIQFAHHPQLEDSSSKTTILTLSRALSREENEDVRRSIAEVLDKMAEARMFRSSRDK